MRFFFAVAKLQFYVDGVKTRCGMTFTWTYCRKIFHYFPHDAINVILQTIFVYMKAYMQAMAYSERIKFIEKKGKFVKEKEDARKGK